LIHGGEWYCGAYGSKNFCVNMRAKRDAAFAAYPGIPSALSWEAVRVSAASFSGLKQAAAIDRFFCKLDCLLGC
jgi:hypothetical protein